MESRETDNGSFESRGIGFVYEYISLRGTLSVRDIESGQLLAEILSDKLNPENVVAYTSIFDKVTQITALTLSRRRTINLIETIDLQKIPALLEGASILANYAFDLYSDSFGSFCARFRHDYEFDEISIGKVYGDNFEAFLRTRYGHNALASGDSLAGLLQNMANTIVQDLITLEFSSRYGTSAQRLLSASSTLNLTARVLDNKFIPKHKIIGSRKPPEKIRV